MNSIPVVNFIGCGRLGQTLGYLFVQAQAAQIQCIVTRTLETSRQAIQKMGSGIPCTEIKELKPATIYWIATSDDLIQKKCEELSNLNLLNDESLVIHSSGLLSSEVLESAKCKGALTGSIHPLHSFASPSASVSRFAGTYCAFEGDAEGLKILLPLFKAIKAEVFEIKKEQKVLYHAAAVVASNYLVTLFQTSLDCYRQTGISDRIATPVILSLMNSTLENLKSLSPADALTGPIRRGDLVTIKKHLESLENNPILYSLYQALGLSTVALTSHSYETKNKLLELFNRKD